MQEAQEAQASSTTQSKKEGDGAENDYELEKADHEAALKNLDGPKRTPREEVLRRRGNRNKLFLQSAMEKERRSPKMIGKIKSIQDKIDQVKVKPDGTVEHLILKKSHRTYCY
mmetsp:Transcript_11159/g.18744  ORF Transcript_11159/g.18744 Transcript_11159/m.18744 type:complete len:113 (+) Transcript_11159:359-697(+)